MAATPQQVVTTLAIPVRCHPAGEGGHSSLVTLTTDGSVAAVTASLTCTGAVPHISLTPSQGVDLGRVRVGASASAEIAVANTTAGNDVAAEGRTLTVTGTATGPVFRRIEPASGELDFVTPSGTLSAPGLVRIANPGNADLHITGATITRRS